MIARNHHPKCDVKKHIDKPGENLPKGNLWLFLIIFLLISPAVVARGEIMLPSIFSDNMVLQRDLKVPIWGSAAVGEVVTVKFAGQTKQTQADQDGKWMLYLDPLTTSSEEQTLVIDGSNQLRITGVLVGEVWLCSGQSNMADSFNSSKNRFIEPKYFESGLEHMRVSTRNGWTPIDSKTQRTVSRVGFYFGEKLYRELGVPIGLILRYNSGTPIQSWIPKEESEVIRKRLDIPEDWNDFQENRNPGVQFADKIAPIIPVCFRGVIWYQGERNAKAETGYEYRDLLPFMIETWRKRFTGHASGTYRKFPFYFVQVPTQDSTGEWPWLRDSMRRVLSSTSNTGMAVFYDHGPSLHPDNKKVAGTRLALWALAKDYGYADLEYSGPLLKEVRYNNHRAEIEFDHIAKGLKNRNGNPKQLEFFEIAGQDGKYVPAHAEIVGDQVHVTHPNVNQPKYVRYLFRKTESNPTGSLVNSEDLPASSFITDDFKPPRNIPVDVNTEEKPNGRRSSLDRGPTETPANSSQRNPMSYAELVSLSESGQPAPAIENLNLSQVSYSNERKLPDLNQPYIDTSPEDMADGIEVGELGQDTGNKELVLNFANEIASGKHGEIDSLLIHHDGRLIFESYYRRGRVNYPHYQMSITKSYTALALGRAMTLGYITMADLKRPALEFLDEINRNQIAVGSDTITLHDALNMHSGIRISQLAATKLRKPSQSLQGQGLIQAFLEESGPIDSQSKQYKYQSSDPSIVMQVIQQIAPQSAKKMIVEELLNKLGITKFGWQDDASGLPKSAAGSSMRSRDMIKFGVLVRNAGRWDGEQLIPEEFIQKATSRIYTNPQNTSYGFFWWTHDAEVNGKSYTVKSARGAGGQFILVIDDLDLIIAITAHNQGMGNMLQTAPHRLIPAVLSQ